MIGRTPTRTASGENFPVGSLLIAARLRPSVLRFYDAARASDDIADDPALSGTEKLRQLDRFEAVLIGDMEAADLAPAHHARDTLSEPAIGRLRQLLRAFRRDAIQPRCADWEALMAYCADSANPVGRFLLDLHGEDAAGYPASDALCTALQVLNHLQDCGEDYRLLDRIYLPADWLQAEGVAESALSGAQTTPGLREVLDRCLDEVEHLLDRAAPLPLQMRSTRLALESAAVLALAVALAARLKREDPLARRVRLSRPAMLAVGAWAALRCLWRRTLSAGRPARRSPA
ncbi:squalene/phytoene synthase family protein [Thalassobaculum sp. OXR-137]|uniref:squalene/phytoene synthase family protein n=1 Tax=Thalassobaculum sp. OXR-137 TaxID=3100173 RepID=UPI002AC925A6|nr:squalene/phytoene synthase family protein [Thalassobaculum sp. OXR-137]WPZ32447.1 squalene/phytoene synthase family protein [Thalassobaculum sp. OXR-137]